MNAGAPSNTVRAHSSGVRVRAPVVDNRRPSRSRTRPTDLGARRPGQGRPPGTHAYRTRRAWNGRPALSAVLAERGPMVMAYARAGYVELPEGWARRASPWFRTLRDPRGVPPSRRFAARVGVPVAPQAPRRRPVHSHLVGTACDQLVDRRPLRRRLALLRRSWPCSPYATRVGTDTDNLTYFIGSIFFTSAAFLQYHEAASSRTTLHRPAPSSPATPLLPRLQHHRIDWWASLIQLVGTLWFNRTTFSAWVVGLGVVSDHHPVWRPDASGSVCFLVSSRLAWAEECHGSFAWRPRDLSWRITLLNFVGSVALASPPWRRT